jgi:sugar lactone lactonase YvrE
MVSVATPRRYGLDHGPGSTDPHRAATANSSVRRFVLLALPLLALAACGDDGGQVDVAAPAPTTTTTPERCVPTGTGVPTLTLAQTIRATGGFDHPSFVAVDDEAGRLYVTDSGNGRIVSTDLHGEDPVVLLDDGEPFRFADHGDLGSADVAPDGSLVVAESGERRVAHLAADGTPLPDLASPDGYDRLFTASVGADGRVYAVDDEGNDVTVLDLATGAAEATLAEGDLTDPGSVEALDDGTLWVADAGGGTVLHLAADGRVLATIGEGDVEYPNDVAVDDDGRVWVTDFEGGGVVAFDADGTLIGRYDMPELAEPVSLAFAADGALYVSDWSEDLVLRYEVS